MSFYKELLEVLQNNAKLSLLKEAKGKKALDVMKAVLFETAEEANVWAKQFSKGDVQAAHLVVYSRLKRTQKEIVFKFLIKDTTSLGETMTYAKGMKILGMYFG